MDRLNQKSLTTSRSRLHAHDFTLTTSRSLRYPYHTSTEASENKPALLFCHDFLYDSFLWNDVIEHLTETGILSERKVIVPNMLGYGGTSKPLRTALHNYAGMADNVHEILDAENVSTVTIIGHDWGAV